ncbi:MAG TPA: hypothetical protein VHG69_08405 [Thermoleophilaceae bacterium]|nr:hypothetical protein [Thermoleophilaceae bacterium]
MTMQGHEESDQRPEDAPDAQVPDDDGDEARDQAEENAGVPGEDDQSTGNPEAAGSEDPEDDSE